MVSIALGHNQGADMEHENKIKILGKAVGDSDKLLTTAEAADILGVTEWTLRRWRSHGSRLPYRKLSGQMVRYTIADIRWSLEDGRVMPAEYR